MACRVLIGIGSNLGNRLSCLQRAAAAVDAEGGQIIAVSSAYESEPVGGCADQRFLNAVLCCETELSPHKLWERLLAIEQRLGRVRTQRWANRTVDIDILLWQKANGDEMLVNLPDLKIPHPRMLFRDFVMLPALEIAPHWQHAYAMQPLTKLHHMAAKSIVRRLRTQL